MPKFSYHGRSAFTIPQGGGSQTLGTGTLLGAMECCRGIRGRGLREETKEMRAKRFGFCLLVLEIWTDLQYPFGRRGSGATGS